MAPIVFSYDLFLSYNSANHGIVEDVARRLRAEGLKPFLDRWYLAPGARWRTNLEDTLNSSKAIAVFVGPGEMGSWQQREVDVALDLQSRSPNLPVIPVLLPGSTSTGFSSAIDLGGFANADTGPRNGNFGESCARRTTR